MYIISRNVKRDIYELCLLGVAGWSLTGSTTYSVNVQWCLNVWGINGVLGRQLSVSEVSFLP